MAWVALCNRGTLPRQVAGAPRRSVLPKAMAANHAVATLVSGPMPANLAVVEPPIANCRLFETSIESDWIDSDDVGLAARRWRLDVNVVQRRNLREEVAPHPGHVPIGGLQSHPVAASGVHGKEFIPRKPVDVTCRDISTVFEPLSTPCGTVVNVKVSGVESKGPGDPQTLQLLAATPLAVDQWHWLVIEQNDTFRIAGTRSAHFFTGSAPRVIRVQGSTAKNPDILNILFSEPVDAATIDAAILARIGNRAVGNCVLRGAACVDKTVRFATESIDLRLNIPFSAAAADIAVLGAVKGSGRTVAEGASASGDPYADGKLTRAVPATAWRTCDDSRGNPTEFCWQDERGVPIR